jgi:MFS family permease
MPTQITREIITRDFILAFLAQLASSLIFFGLIPTLPIYLAELGSNEVETGVLLGVFFFCSLICRPFVGKALLRTPERKFMIWGSFLYLLASIAYLFSLPFWPFFAVRVLHGIGFGFFHTSSFTFIANTASKSHRGQSLSYFSLAMTVASALAPAIGMVLINRSNFTILFLLCSGLSFCTLLVSHQLGRRETALQQPSSTGKGLLLNSKAIPPSVTNSISLFMWGALAAFFPLYAVDHGVENPGLFFTTVAIMLLLGRSFGGKFLDLYRRESVILPCLIAYVISVAILAFSETLPMFILVGVIWGIGNAFSMPSLVAHVLDRVGSSTGPAMGTYTAISDLGLSLGPVTMGLVIQVAGYQAMFLCLAFTGLINVIYFHFFARKEP